MEVGSVSIELDLDRTGFDTDINQISNLKLAPLNVVRRMYSKSMPKTPSSLKLIEFVVSFFLTANDSLSIPNWYKYSLNS
ncbi:hypothetical protein NIES4071_00780 [Calothrix sp. NIES-4071]|nr:hypothetical protein NIES4071_00780 [Calothrix sp. NIES-4071]BAZ54424.1 hypothetical protein NIES4105_00770 [Calothrix sp. NIES-4105]